MACRDAPEQNNIYMFFAKRSGKREKKEIISKIESEYEIKGMNQIDPNSFMPPPQKNTIQYGIKI